MTNVIGFAAFVSIVLSFFCIAFATLNLEWTIFEVDENESLIIFSPRGYCFHNGTEHGYIQPKKKVVTTLFYPFWAKFHWTCFPYSKGQHSLYSKKGKEMQQAMREYWFQYNYAPDSWCNAPESYEPDEPFLHDLSNGMCSMLTDICVWFSSLSLLLLFTGTMCLLSSLIKVSGFPHLAAGCRTCTMFSFLMMSAVLGIWIWYSESYLHLHRRWTKNSTAIEHKQYGSSVFTLIHGIIFLFIATCLTHRFAKFQQFRIMRHRVPTEEPADPLDAPPCYKVTSI